MPETATGETATSTLADYARQALEAANGGAVSIDHHDPRQTQAFKAAVAALLTQADEDAELANLLDEDGDMADQLAVLRASVLTDKAERALLTVIHAPKEA